MELVMEQEAPAGEVCLTPEAMDAYLDTLRQQGRSADTLAAYPAEHLWAVPVAAAGPSG